MVPSGTLLSPAPLAALALLLLAAAIPLVRPLAAVLVLAAWCVAAASGRRGAGTIALAAIASLAVVMPWPLVLGTDVPIGDPACTSPISEIAMRRLVVACAGLALAWLAARSAGASREELGLRRPGRVEAAVAIAAVAVLAIGGLWIGPAIAEPFFGRLDFPTPVAALVPAVVFGVANGVLEEVQYRGVLQGLLGRIAPAWVAIGVQGLVFGFVHAGPEVLALLPVHVAMLGAVGVAGGIARRRLGSVWIPAGVHVGADIALYVGLACRAAA